MPGGTRPVGELIGVNTSVGVFASTELIGVSWNVGIFPVTVGFKWGAITGTTAGELLRVQYSGATITGAVLELADGRVLELDVAAGELSVLLPADTPAGVAHLTATLEDGSTVELDVYLTGVVVVTERVPGPPAAPRHRRAPRRTVLSPSRVVLHSGTRLRTRHPARTLVLLRAGVRVHRSRPADRRLTSPSRLLLVPSTRVTAAHGSVVTVTLATDTRIGRRGVEEALLALGLL